MDEPVYIIEQPAPGVPQQPILISAPHVGTAFPEALKPRFKAEILAHPEDTDWLVDKLYAFGPAHGFTQISAHCSRYVVDLNRPPDGKNLYQDGRFEVSVIPTTTFRGQGLYRGQLPDEAERQERISRYHNPYYQKITDFFTTWQKIWPHVLFFDAHSIKRSVPEIRPEPFPDLILGSRDGQSCHPELIRTALETLRHQGFSVSHNTPFKGGHLTRTFGDPARGWHALQLEMSQDIYLAEGDKVAFHGEKSAALSRLLNRLLTNLAQTLRTLS